MELLEANSGSHSTWAIYAHGEALYRATASQVNIFDGYGACVWESTVITEDG